MFKKDYMTVKGIGEKEGNSLYRDLEGYPDGILYYEDTYTELLFRQVINQDIKLVKKSRKITENKLMIQVADKKDSKTVFVPLSKVRKEDMDEQILEKIRNSNPENDKIFLVVFNLKTKDFIVFMDIQTIQDSDWTECAVNITMSDNKAIRQQYEVIIKKKFQQICKSSGLYKNGCKEIVWRGEQEYELVPF